VVHPAPATGAARCSTACWRATQAPLLPRAGIVHRLDKDTSGLMVVARTARRWTAGAR
jgi:23S rRNA pseudouridine1911/1915/1917 synthase